MNYLPTCTLRLVVQHPSQVSGKSMQQCRRSWEDKLKCVKILSVKGHNSAKICQTWIISPHALSTCGATSLPSFKFKSMQGCRRSWEDKLLWDGRKEWWKDGRMTDKANTKCPLALWWRGHNKMLRYRHINEHYIHFLSYFIKISISTFWGFDAQYWKTTYNRLAALLTKYRTIIDLERQIGCHQTTPLMADANLVKVSLNVKSSHNKFPFL